MKSEPQDIQDICVFVTGASGFIGAEVLNVLSRRGIETHALSRKPLAQKNRAGTVWHHSDLLRHDLSLLLEAIQPTHCIHLGWEATPKIYRDSRANYDWVESTTRLAESFIKAGGKHFIMAGSCAEYALPAHICDETSTLNADDCAYAVCKARTAAVLSSLMRDAGGRFSSGRIFYAYGPNEPQGKFIQHVCQGLASGVPVPLSDGTDVLDYIYRTDVANAFVALALSNVGGAVNIGSGKAITVRDIAVRLGKIAGRPELLEFGKVRSTRGLIRIVANNDRLVHQVGYLPTVTLDQGLQACYDFWNKSSDSIGHAIKNKTA